MARKARIWKRDERGKWYGSYRIPYSAPERKVYKSFDTRADAVRWKKWIEYKLNYGEWQGIKGQSLEQATKIYLEEKAAHNTESSIAEIERSLNVFTDIVGRLRTDLITTATIAEFINKRKDYGRHKTRKTQGDYQEHKPSPATINKDLRNLKAFMRWAAENNIAHQVKFQSVKEDREEFRPPSMDKLNELFGIAKDTPELYIRMILALATGRRRGALERIKLNVRAKEHIDLAEGVITAYESKTKEYVTTRLGANVLRIVRDYVESLPAQTTMLFPRKWDGKIRTTWDKAREKAGLPDLDFHDLRNMAVSILGAKGESPAVLQKQLRHSSYQTTERYYVGVDQATADRVTETLDDVIGSF